MFMDYTAGPELRHQLAEIEARSLSSQPATIDYPPRIAQLEQQRANFGFFAVVRMDKK
ncbi:MAG: hypothetical protein WCB10_09270 [Steroidobacteraceae bacterium]